MGQFAFIFGVVAIAILLFRIVGSVFLGDPGKELNQKFVKMGSLTGKSKEEIVSKVGGVSSQTTNSDNSFVCTWSAGTYSISVLFSADNKCEKIIHEKLK